MPLYEYECAKCGCRTEVIQRMGDGPIGACSDCGGEMKRLLSAPAFQFKGSGWYVTDYARKGQSSEKAEKEDKPKQSDSDGSKAKTSKAGESSAKETKKTSD
jgi:putative FmdB family regulatory protein